MVAKLALALGRCIRGKTGLVFRLIFATVFHVEVFAIIAGIRESIATGYNAVIITTFKAALKALESVTVMSVSSRMPRMPQITSDTKLSSTGVGAGA